LTELNTSSGLIPGLVQCLAADVFGENYNYLEYRSLIETINEINRAFHEISRRKAEMERISKK
jgi:hypothetical protein